MINILYVFDDNYAQHAGISITSLLESNRINKKQSIRIFCAGMDVSVANIEKINKTVAKYEQQLQWLDTTEALHYIDGYETGYWNGSKATWMKVFVLWKLPEDVNTILYLDSDTIVLDDLSEFNNDNVIDSPTAQVLDSLGNTYGKKELGLYEYYNAGIIYFNVRVWKDKKFKNHFLNFFVCNSGKYRDNEQGLLNDYLRGKIKRLPLKYNYQGFLMLYDEKVYLSEYNDFPFYDIQELCEARKKPTICHFFRVFGDYPWEKNNMHPMRCLYNEWKEKSLWRNEEEIKKPPNCIFEIQKKLYKLLFPYIYIKIYRKIVEYKI